MYKGANDRLAQPRAELRKGKSSYYGIGGTDLILVNESGKWLIGDAYAFRGAVIRRSRVWLSPQIGKDSYDAVP